MKLKEFQSMIVKKYNIRNLVSFIVLTLLGFVMVSLVLEMPTFGNLFNPANNYVYREYVTRAEIDTGTKNIVTSIISDFRAFDTLGETTVLFTGIAAVLGTLIAHSKTDKGEDKEDE